MRALDLAGRRFGRLVVVRRIGSVNGRSLWVCRCDCGAEAEVMGRALTIGDTSSCGCLHRETFVATTHGHTRGGQPSQEYRSWASMWQRVRATKGRAFHYYGARGITVCDRWRDFEAFLVDMGPKPIGTSIDRIDNARGYEPGNCRWATPIEQARNRRPRRTGVRRRRAVQPEGGAT